MISPHTSTPTIRAAIHEPTQRLVTRSVCSVAPSGIQPRATVSLHAVVNIATATPSTASRSFAPLARSPRCERTGGLPDSMYLILGTHFNAPWIRDLSPRHRKPTPAEVETCSHHA